MSQGEFLVDATSDSRSPFDFEEKTMEGRWQILEQGT